MAAIVSVSTLQGVFERRGLSVATLKRTIANSQKRLSGNLSASAEQTEINRIQGAANALEKRGTYASKVYAATKKKELEKHKEKMPFLRKHKTALEVGAVALLLVGFLVAKS